MRSLPVIPFLRTFCPNKCFFGRKGFFGLNLINFHFRAHRWPQTSLILSILLTKSSKNKLKLKTRRNTKTH